MQYTLQKEQLESSIKAVESKSIPSLPQIRILESQVKAQQEQIRVFQLQLNSAKREKVDWKSWLRQKQHQVSN